MAYQRVLQAELVDDIVVQTHVSELYDDLLQKNLALLVEPFSRVEIAHVAALINLPMVRIVMAGLQRQSMGG